MGRAVWTDERGDRIYSRLKGEPLATGRRIVGTITGGTGRYAALEGEYSFTWQYVVAAEDGAIQGRAVRLEGRVRRTGARRDAVGRRRRKALLARAAVLALAPRHLVLPGARGPGARRPGTCSRSSSRRSSRSSSARFPILTSSVLALAAAVLTGTLAPAKAYSGFANGTILLIVVAFLVARAVVKCGLGERLGHLVVSALRAVDARPRLQHLPGRRRDRAGLPEQHRPLRRPLPARPLARRGGGGEAGRRGPPAPRQLPDVLGHREPHRLVGALVHGDGREPARGRDRARRYGLEIGFGSWLVASSVPTLAAMALLPLVLYKVDRARR